VHWGTSFLTALCDKYDGTRLDTLRNVSLTGAPPPPAPHDPSCVYVARAYDLGTPRIADTCAAIVALDLSRSLLASWTDVAAIAAELPRLESLALSHTRIALDTDLSPRAFAHVRDLYLSAADVSWAAACAIARAMPALTTLELAYNGLDSCEQPLYAPQLRSLNLEGNALADWAQIAGALRSAPLTKLVLTDNHITAIPPAQAPLPALHEVVLTGNPIDAWPSLEALESWVPASLALCASLEQLAGACVTGTRGAASADDLRYEAIARLARLDGLDHSPVSPAERRDAERYFVARAHTHPRLAELRARHGGPPPTAADRTLRTKLVDVLVARSTSPPTPATVPSLRAAATRVSLLRTAPLRVLQRRLAIACGGAAHASAVVYAVLQAAAEPIIFPLDDPLQELDAYGVSNDDLLVIT